MWKIDTIFAIAFLLTGVYFCHCDEAKPQDVDEDDIEEVDNFASDDGKSGEKASYWFVYEKSANVTNVRFDQDITVARLEEKMGCKMFLVMDIMVGKDAGLIVAGANCNGESKLVVLYEGTLQQWFVQK